MRYKVQIARQKLSFAICTSRGTDFLTERGTNSHYRNSMLYFRPWSGHKRVNTTLDSTNCWLQPDLLESTIGWIQGGVNTFVFTPEAKIMHGIPAIDYATLFDRRYYETADGYCIETSEVTAAIFPRREFAASGLNHEKSLCNIPTGSNAFYWALY